MKNSIWVKGKKADAEIKEEEIMKRLIISLVIALAAVVAQAQCTYKNTAFKSGEFLTYNLYYNWQFIWVKAGTASMSTV